MIPIPVEIDVMLAILNLPKEMQAADKGRFFRTDLDKTLKNPEDQPGKYRNFGIICINDRRWQRKGVKRL